MHWVQVVMNSAGRWVSLSSGEACLHERRETVYFIRFGVRGADFYKTREISTGIKLLSSVVIL
jgi:hypothetical protein